ncbi:MAG TPA: SDR family oxidoreductase [Mycobacteriales bacterium]|nr:SDR family oxidoreductase [Mycobacteriales bacterium]
MAKLALITGGSRGIGAVTATLLAGRGWDVCLSYREDADAAATVVRDCEATGVGAIAVRADVSVETDVIELFAQCDARLGALDTLINNAGIVGPRARVDELGADRLQQMMAVNVIGPFLCVREAVRRMSTRHGGAGGSIVNVSSAAARLGSPGEYVDYAASKGAIDTMTLGLAREVADEGVRVNAVRPGIIDTDIHASGGQPDRAERLGPTLPMKRVGRAVEVASAIGWLCSDEASYVTGAILDISGAR